MKKFIIGIKNLITWFPIIWKDRQFDYSYLLGILEHKLKLTEQFFSSDNAFTVDAAQMAEQMKTVKDAIHRLAEDDYIPDEVFNDPDKLHKFIEQREEEKLIQKDLNLAFNTMRDNVRGWWD